MSDLELLIVSATPGLSEALSRYEGLRVPSGPTLSFAANLLASLQPPQALYIEDSAGSLAEMWEVVQSAQRRGVAIFVGLRGAGQSRMVDFNEAGVPTTTERDPEALARWLGEQLGLRERRAGSRTILAVAGAKGGIGKTLVTALIGEGMVRRGLRVLVIDGDVSNSGIVPTFRIPSGFPSYFQLRDDGSGGWTPENLRRIVYHHQASGIDFLLGSEETADTYDLVKSEWEALIQAVRCLDEYDVILLDTGPEIKKRPYALLAARDGGYVLLPTPPGRKERTGVGNVLRVFQSMTPDLTERCLLLYMEPEKGVQIRVQDIMPLFERLFPLAKSVGVLPRAPRQVSLAEEASDAYLSPLDIAPHSAFSRSAHTLVETLCAKLGVTPRIPMQRPSWWQRLRGERLAKPAAASSPSLQKSMEAAR